jgi:hypothetical protein
MEEKPEGAGKAFAELGHKLVQVPKREIVRAEKRYQKRKQRKRKS